MPADVNLEGFKLVVDCANGAAYNIAKELFERLGAKVHIIGNKPDGKNINVGCGSLYLDNVCKVTKKLKYDCGLALDGDADRALLSDEKGNPMDGDDIIDNGKLENQAFFKWIVKNREKIDLTIIEETIE
jgi:phosphoglucosamine mutase